MYHKTKFYLLLELQHVKYSPGSGVGDGELGSQLLLSRVWEYADRAMQEKERKGECVYKRIDGDTIISSTTVFTHQQTVNLHW